MSEAVLTDVQFIALDYIPMGVLVLKETEVDPIVWTGLGAS